MHEGIAVGWNGLRWTAWAVGEAGCFGAGRVGGGGWEDGGSLYCEFNCG